MSDTTSHDLTSLPASETELADAAQRQRIAAARRRAEALRHLRDGDIAAAKQTFAIALAEHPADVESLYQLGLLALTQEREPLRAKACFCAVLSIDPTHAAADRQLRDHYLGA